MTVPTTSDQAFGLGRSRRRADPLSPIELQRWNQLTSALPRSVITARLNGNAKTLLSLRGDPRGLRLSLHRGLLDYPEVLAEIPVWCARPGHATPTTIRQAISDLFIRLGRAAASAPVPEFAPLLGRFDADECLERLRNTWFPALSLPLISWGPRRSPRRTRRIRFGAYHRSPPSRIVLNRQLDQAWVARDFAELVVYHELCHHAQAQQPLRGERPHGPRFRGWEQRFPRYHDILAWERANLHRFLAPDHVPD